MKEQEYLCEINKALSDSSFLGDDCAFLPSSFLGSEGLYITHDSLIEDVHFKKKFITPYQLGKKAVFVNLSDLAAMCAKPLVLTISLSLPEDVDENFVFDFYKGVNEVCNNLDVKVAGGDLTGSDKIFVSICAIGAKTCSYEISRKFAKIGDVIVTTGPHGDSAGGLRLLFENKKAPSSLINAHLNPLPQIEKSMILSKAADSNFAVMDTSDGLGDALFKLSKESNVSFCIDFDEVPVSSDLIDTFPKEYKNLVLWGGEDYQLLMCLKKEVYNKLDKNLFFQIGTVEKYTGEDRVKINYNGTIYKIDEKTFNQRSFNHFDEEMRDKQ